MKIYLVGGAVRDRLLGREVVERDWLVVGSTPDEMLQQGYRPVGKDFPVFLHPKSHEEYALARTERKTGRGYDGFQCHADASVTLEEDLLRRDLTVNAIAEDDNGELIDPYNGLADLENRLLRHVSPAFAEDPVRILRIARFAARYASYGFSIAPETMGLMQKMVNDGEVDALVAERVWKEMSRALEEPAPERFFEVLRQCGALKILLPELDQLFGVPQPEQHHPEIDTGIHTLLVLKQAAQLSDSGESRFAALCHDLGKGRTPKEHWPSHHGHEERGVPLIKALCQRLRVPRDYQDLAILTARYHTHCHRALELRHTTLLDTIMELDGLRKPTRFQHFLEACKADCRGRPGFEQQAYPQADYFQTALDIMKNVSVKEIIAAGIKGKQIAQGLRRKRLSALHQQLPKEA